MMAESSCGTPAPPLASTARKHPANIQLSVSGYDLASDSFAHPAVACHHHQTKIGQFIRVSLKL